ncbi:density-regulated protein DRP1 [Ancylostoma duodenale]|uniref:Density-regulated protein n=1 Tax=Ancylostoma duodenale TaxID=51022 RepID=A0A0C2D1E0_9BILA|nr:density-regulated protein DRP1 [Ancylostoma duodenale]
MSESGDVAVVSLAPGPLPGVQYPLKVTYCGECSMPVEYCDYSGMTDKCRKWAEENAPEALEGLEIAPETEGEEKKHQKRGGKGTGKVIQVLDSYFPIMPLFVQSEKKKAPTATKVTLQREPRGKKSVTVIKGLAGFEIDLKQASKLFAQKFACGSSVTGADEIVIQGDVKDDLFDMIPAKWPQVSEDMIDDLGDKKR